MTDQPELHMPGWPEMRFHGRAETDGTIWWWEDRNADGSFKRHPLQPYDYIVAPNYCWPTTIPVATPVGFQDSHRHGASVECGEVRRHRGCFTNVSSMQYLRNARNALKKEPKVRYDWTALKLKQVQRWVNRRIWRVAKFVDYDSSIKTRNAA